MPTNCIGNAANGSGRRYLLPTLARAFFIVRHYVLASLAMVTATAYGEDIECTRIESPVARLTCFDQAFRTPLYESEKLRPEMYATDSVPQGLPKAVKTIFQFPSGDGLYMIKQADVAKTERKSMGMAFKSPVETPFAPTLFFGCIDNITHFQIALQQPLNSKKVRARFIDMASSKVLFEAPWQVLERGYLLDMGRGLYAIEKIKRLLGTQQVIYQIPALQAEWYFELPNLKAQIKPMRKECSW